MRWGPRHRIAVLVPGHREGRVLVEAARSALEDDYPRALRTVWVIADHCTPDVVRSVRDIGADVLELSLPSSTKVRSLRMALSALSDEWDTIVVLDADNLMERGFLRRIDAARQDGAQAIQGWRAAKNHDTAMARLDGLMEDVHHVAFRAGQRALGLPAHFAGSGMAFDRGLLQWALDQSDPVGGFDKDLQATFADRGIDVAWVPDAVVYDEKVESSSALATQRRRWLSTQLTFLPRYAAVAWRGLLRGDLTGTALLGLALIPPRSLLLLGLVATLLLSLMLGKPLAAGLAATGLAALALAIVAAAGPRRVATTLPAVLPALFAMVAAALRLRGADRRFIHTPHVRAVGLDELDHRKVLP
jgi:cellulose synthase/poly-beta-1,6-N-acetylglucosamine synthase-like glycosyltransferase